MEKTNWIILVIIATVVLGCFNAKEYNQNKAKAIIKENAEYYKTVTELNSFLDHLPSVIRNDSFNLFTAGPSCPPAYECSAQFGDLYLRLEKSTYEKELTELLQRDVIYSTHYMDTINIIIHLSELKKDMFPIPKCNQYYEGKIPIPYLESYDFGLGKNVLEKEIDGKVYREYKYVIPEDLMVYVVDADSGDFWKVNCNEKRPEELKEWQHGYSKGVAISEKEDIAVYWAIIW